MDEHLAGVLGSAPTRWGGRSSSTVQHVGIEVESVRPDDRPQLRVDTDLPEVRPIPERLPHRAPEFVGEVDDALAAIVERQTER